MGKIGKKSSGFLGFMFFQLKFHAFVTTSCFFFLKPLLCLRSTIDQAETLPMDLDLNADVPELDVTDWPLSSAKKFMKFMNY